MCGSFTQPGDISIIDSFRARFGVEVSDDPGDAGQPINREQKATPFHDVNVIFADSDGVNKLGAMYWQLIHHWNREFRSKHTAFNTRVDSLDKRHNEPLPWHRRWILPVSSFFETRKIGGQPVKPKETYEFALQGEGLMALGGIYALWLNPADENDRHLSCSIITLEPNEIIAEVHDRMPFIIPEESIRAWLDPEVADVEEPRDLIVPFPSSRLKRLILP
ncbi:MAG: SOS response-associated peptidase [Thermoleophilia bacterium]